MYKVKLEKFEGPLHLLLSLIEKEDLDINQISLARIADEYIEYVNVSKNIELGELADFLYVASKLLYIKSKSLLPYLIWDEEDEEITNLEEQLKIYKEFKDASLKLEQMVKTKNYLFARERLILPKGFYPPQSITTRILAEMFARALDTLEPVIKSGQIAKEKVISISEKIIEIKNEITRRARIKFFDIIKGAKNKTEAIVSFLALLELIKQKIANVSQENMFGDIEIYGTKK